MFKNMFHRSERPLVFDQNLNETVEIVKKKDSKYRDTFDIVEKYTGILGNWQIWIIFLVSLVKVPVTWHQMNIIFLAPPINFKCIDENVDRCSSNCSGYIYDQSIFQRTITMDWNLVCGKQYLESMTQTLKMSGILIGCFIFGFFSDKFGRKNPMLITVVLQGSSGIVAAVSPWFPLFLVMMFISGISTGGAMVTSFILVMEISGTRWRTMISVLHQLPVMVGQVFMALISYFLRDWRYFMIATSIPSFVLLVVYYWMAPESPRWQLAAGDKIKSAKTLKMIARKNTLPTNTIDAEVASYLQNQKDKHIKQTKGNVFDLLKSPIIRTFTIILWMNWLCCGFVFFGTSQFIGQLGGDPFFNAGLAGVLQMPGILFCAWAIDVWGRKKMLIFANVFAGVSLLLTAVVPDEPIWVKPFLACLATSGAVMAFATAYVYSGEIFPTVLRNVGSGSSSMFSRLGSMVSPFAATLSVIQQWIPPLLFGLVMLMSAVLCIWLPETLGCKLPETVEEVESWKRKKTAADEQSENHTLDVN